MKIRINDEYSNLEEDFNIVADKYFNEDDIRTQDMRNGDIENEKDYLNATYYESAGGDFNVEIQYSQDGSYTDNSNKYSEYDKFCYDNELNGLKEREQEKYYDNSCENKYLEECEAIDNLSICPEECMEQNGYSAVEQNCNKNYPIDYFNNYDSKCSSNYENNCETCEDDYGIKYDEKCNCSKGRIEVCVKLGDKNGVEIKGAKINLYELNGVCPKLYESKLTDCNGKAIFENLENECYRVISLVDRRYFEKPTYITWNEVTIDDCVKDANICVVNKIKPSCIRR